MTHTKLIIGLGILVVVGILFYTLPARAPHIARDYKNTTYLIGDRAVTLVDGVEIYEEVPGSASGLVETHVFGNELITDLDGDGRDDVALILERQTGGTGVFYYLVGALNTPTGYVGTEGYLLGDRVAPQPITKSPNPRHVRVIVANYATRAPGEAMSTPPSVGTSVYLKLDPATRTWGVVVPNFEGESAR